MNTISVGTPKNKSYRFEYSIYVWAEGKLVLYDRVKYKDFMDKPIFLPPGKYVHFATEMGEFEIEE